MITFGFVISEFLRLLVLFKGNFHFSCIYINKEINISAPVKIILNLRFFSRFFDAPLNANSLDITIIFCFPYVNYVVIKAHSILCRFMSNYVYFMSILCLIYVHIRLLQKIPTNWQFRKVELCGRDLIDPAGLFTFRGKVVFHQACGKVVWV